MRIKFDLIFLLLLFIAIVPAVKAQAKKMKIYISVDMEGVVGVVSADQLTPAGFEYQRFREF
ncbi:MAG: M55 family metallopeptidase, partial [Acidobacteriota bacterium]